MAKKTKKKIPKKVSIFKFAFATDHGYWNETKSYFDSEKSFRKLFPDLPGAVIRLDKTKIVVPADTVKPILYPKSNKPSNFGNHYRDEEHDECEDYFDIQGDFESQEWGDR